jgi:hypothetical protein
MRCRTQLHAWKLPELESMKALSLRLRLWEAANHDKRQATVRLRWGRVTERPNQIPKIEKIVANNNHLPQPNYGCCIYPR